MHPALLELELLVDPCTKTLELVPLLPATRRGLLHVTGGRAQSCSTRTCERERAALHSWTIGLLMADNRPVHPLGLAMDQAAAAEEPAADPASAASIFGHRLGCALHVLHLAVTAGMPYPCFMGPLGVAS